MLKVWSIIRPFTKKVRKSEAGFSPIEVLLAATIFGMLVVSLVGVIVFGRASTASAGDRVRASQLAEEGLEAVRNIRDSGFTNIADGTYGLVQSGGVWTLSGSSDTTGIYTRQVTISTVSPTRKTATANVTWPQRVGLGALSFVARLTDWRTALTTWTEAVMIGSYDVIGSNNGLKVATVGNYAYAVRDGGSPNTVIVNISNPASPTLAGSLNTASLPTNIDVSGNYAYVTTSSNTAELQVIDVSNPVTPTIVATYDAPGGGDGLAVDIVGNYAYLSRASNGGTSEFMILDTSSPTAPTVVGSYGNNISMNDVKIAGNYAYIGTNSNSQELLILDISNPALPTLAALMDLPGNGNVQALSWFDNKLFIGLSSGVTSVGVTNPLAPTVLGSYAISGATSVNDVDVHEDGGYLFIGVNNPHAEFQIIDISDPANMSAVRTVDVAGGSGTVNGVAYNASLNIVVAVDILNAQEILIFGPN